MDLQKAETISKIIAAVFIPAAVAFFGAQINVANKQKDTEAKLVELATIILNKEIPRSQSLEQKHLRKWAVDIINAYSGVTMSTDTQTALVDRLSLPAATPAKPADDDKGTFGVVFGGDKTIEEALYEVERANKALEAKAAQVFLRSGSYRTVVVFVSRADAEEALGKLKSIRNSAYIVDMSKWCMNTTRQSNYFDCKL